MAEGFITRRGGGGCAATTNIITIASETELPANPKEGTIAIVTTTAIGKIYAQSIIPESPSVGDLWFAPSGVANVVYIAEKEAYAIKAIKQYNGTDWETVNAFQYSEGAWTTKVYLLNGSDECELITAGWKAIAIRRADDWTTSETQVPTVTKIDGGIILTQTADGYASGAYHTAQKIDVSKYDVLRIQGSVDIKCYGQIRLVSAIGSYSESNTVLVEELPESDAIDLTLDVSSLDGDYYILFDIATNGNSSTIFTLTKIWLDKVTYLFNAGDQCESVTGGWEIYSQDDGAYAEFSPDVMYIGGSDYNWVRVNTSKKINLSGFSRLCINIVAIGGSYTGHMVYLETEKTVNDITMFKPTGTGLWVYDISGFSGECYLSMVCGNNAAADMSQIYLER